MLVSQAQNWLDSQITLLLSPIRSKLDDNLDPNIKPHKFQLFENLGTLKIEKFHEFINKINPEDKRTL